MLTRWTTPLLLLALVQFAPSAMAADPANFAELKEQMLAAADEIKTWAADINTNMSASGMNMKIKSSMEGLGDQFAATMDM